jgi:site-specific recombinase XerD
MTSDFAATPRTPASPKLVVTFQPSIRSSASPYRLIEQPGHELAWANNFLDSKRVVQRSLHTLRAYAYDLLNFTRWWLQQPEQNLSAITEATLFEYVRYQLDQIPPPTPQTVNHRLFVVRDLARFHGGQLLSAPAYSSRPLAYNRRRPSAPTRLRLTEPRRVILPLSQDQVDCFWNSFHCFRDLAIVGLMLLDGLRSCEVISLQLADLQLADAQVRVLGKGNKQRVLPLPQDLIDALQNYLILERPLTNSPSLFVSLKGRSRGLPLTAAGLRSLFRYHRAVSSTPQANPHRFRHSFGAEMVRAGISLPALQQLMGHAHIRTTMLYVQVAPQDVWREYRLAIDKRTSLKPLSI